MADRCQTCQAPIEWTVSATTGKKMPIDAEPAADGNIVLTGGKAMVLSPIERLAVAAGTPLFRSHFSTCKQADEWRSKAVERGGSGKW